MRTPHRLLFSSSVTDSNITFIGGLFFGVVWDTYVRGNYCYVAAGTSLMIFDVSNLADPKLTGGFFTVHEIHKIIVDGKYAYLLAPSIPPIFFIIDVSDPENPKQTGEFCFEDISRILPYSDFSVSGDYAYFTFWSEGLRILDISNRNSPIEIDAFVPQAPVKGVSVLDSYMYVLEEGRGLAIYERTASTTPTEVGYYSISNSLIDLFVSDSLAYISTYEGHINTTELHILNVTDPKDIQELGGYSTVVERGEIEAIKDIYRADNYIYFTRMYGGLFILDISDPAQPQEAAQLKFTTGVWGLSISGTVASCAAEGGLTLVDTSNPTAPKIQANYKTGQVLAMVAANDYLYVAYGQQGLRVVDISDPAKPKEVGFWKGDTTAELDIGFDFQDLCLSGDLLYAADTQGGIIYVFNVSDPAHPYKIADYELQEKRHAYNFDVQGEYVYVSIPYYYDPVLNEGYFRFLIIDFSNPAVPLEIAHLDIAGIQQGDVMVSGNYGFVGTNNGLAIIDVLDPTNPKLVGHYDEGANVTLVSFRANRAYLSINKDSFVVLDITNPINPIEVGQFSIGSFAAGGIFGGGYVTDNYAFLRLLGRAPDGRHINKVIVLDISNPTNIKEVGYHKIGGINAVFTILNQTIWVVGDYIYIANFYEGLYIFKFSRPTGVVESSSGSPTPRNFTLTQNYPNPFNSETTITYQLPQAAKVNLKIYNLLGQVVRTLVEGHQKPGSHSVHWDGRDNQGRKLPSGVYLYRLEVGRTSDERSFVETRKMLLIR